MEAMDSFTYFLLLAITQLPGGTNAQSYISYPPSVVYFAPPEKVSEAWIMNDRVVIGPQTLWLTYQLSLISSIGAAVHDVNTSTTTVIRYNRDFETLEFFLAHNQVIVRFNHTTGNDGGMYWFALNAVNGIHSGGGMQLIAIGNEDDRTSGPFTSTPPSKIYLMTSQNITLQNLSLVWSHNFTGIAIMQVKIVYKGLKGWEELVTYSKSQSTTQSPSNIHRVHRATVQGRLHFQYAFNETTLTFDNITADDAGMYGFVAFDENGWAFKFIRSRVELIMGVAPTTSVLQTTMLTHETTPLYSSPDTTYRTPVTASISKTASLPDEASYSHKLTVPSKLTQFLHGENASKTEALNATSFTHAATGTISNHEQATTVESSTVIKSFILNHPSSVQGSSQNSNVILSSYHMVIAATTAIPNQPRTKQKDTQRALAMSAALGLTIGLSVGITIAIFILFAGGAYIYFYKAKLSLSINRVEPMLKD